MTQRVLATAPCNVFLLPFTHVLQCELGDPSNAFHSFFNCCEFPKLIKYSFIVKFSIKLTFCENDVSYMTKFEVNVYNSKVVSSHDIPRYSLFIKVHIF